MFNQTFQQTAGAGGAGGGIYASGGAPLTGQTMGPGAGNVTIDNNIIQGNQAGADDGGGIMLRYINGQDTAGPQASWYTATVSNNVIVNNVSALAGALSLQDTLKAIISNNIVANNDSTATSAASFRVGPSTSTPAAAGVVARVHTPALATAIAGSGLAAYSDPNLSGNTIWRNRSFYWDVALNGGQGGLIPDLGAGQEPVYYDMAIIGITGRLNPLSSILTSTAGYDGSNNAGPAVFAAEYVNGGPGHLLGPVADPNMQTIPAFDEGEIFLI